MHTTSSKMVQKLLIPFNRFILHSCHSPSTRKFATVNLISSNFELGAHHYISRGGRGGIEVWVGQKAKGSECITPHPQGWVKFFFFKNLPCPLTFFNFVKYFATWICRLYTPVAWKALKVNSEQFWGNRHFAHEALMIKKILSLFRARLRIEYEPRALVL